MAFEVGQQVQFDQWSLANRSRDEREALSALELSKGVIERIEKKSYIIRWKTNEFHLDVGDFTVENKNGFLTEMFEGEFDSLPYPTEELPYDPQQEEEPEPEKVEVQKPDISSVVFLKLKNIEKVMINGTLSFRATSWSALRTLDDQIVKHGEGDIVDSAVVASAFKLWRLSFIVDCRLQALLLSGVHFGQVHGLMVDLDKNFMKWNSWSPKQLKVAHKHVQKHYLTAKSKLGSNFELITNGFGLVDADV